MSEDTRRMLQPAAIGGVVFGVLSGIPVISLFIGVAVFQKKMAAG